MTPGSPGPSRRSPQPTPVTGSVPGPNSAGPATVGESTESPRGQAGTRRTSTAKVPKQQVAFFENLSGEGVYRARYG
jgi:hypothetical protein